MLHKAIQKLRDAFLVALLITVVLLATACSGLATPTSREPGTTPTTSHPSTVPETSSPTPQLSAGQHLRFDRIPAEQGLSQATVICILQDDQGFMWFGTEDGLNRYDGYNFTVYKHDPEDPNSLSNSWILSMIRDRSGVLWIGTANGGLNRFDLAANRITRYQHDPDDIHSLSNDRVLSVYEDRVGDLWVGTEFGLNRFEGETGTFVHYRHDPDDPGSLSGHSVRAIHQDQDGDLWIGTDAGLDRHSPGSEGFAHYQNDPNDTDSLSHNSVRAILQDSEGALWIGTDDGLNKLEPGSERFIHYRMGANDPHGLIWNEIWTIFEDHSGVLWIGTDGGGLDYYDRKSDTFMNNHHDPLDPHSLSNDFIKSIFQDREGVLWIGTIAGDLNKLDPDKRVFAHYQNDPNHPHSLNNNWVRSFYEDQTGAIWIGTGGGGLNRFDPENGQFAHYVHDPDNPNTLSHNFVSHIRQDSLGMLWIGTGNGVDRLDPSTGEFSHYQHDPDDPHSLSENENVFFVTEDKDGVQWVATIGGGLNRFDRETETFTRYLHDPTDPQSLIHNDVWEIAQNQDGTLWLGTGGGLDRFDPDTEIFTHYRNDPDDPASLSIDFVGPILEAHNGVPWFGTIGGGLDELDQATGEFAHFRESDGLPSDTILEFLEDDAPLDGGGGYFWLITVNGISKFDPRTETFQNYDETDGLPFKEFNGGALIRSSSGVLYAGGLEGFIVFHPDQVRDNPTIPPVVITAITQGGEEIPIEKTSGYIPEITFKWPNNAFEFEYAALSYADPDENQYAYYLEGFEETWNEVETRRYGQYTNLPGGTYTLRVKGSNNDGVWNKAGAALQVTIVPPFSATWWFRGIVLLVLVGGAIGGYRLRVRSVEARSRELETQVVGRTKELAALNAVASVVSRSLDLNQVLTNALDKTLEVIEIEAGGIYLLQEDAQTLGIAAHKGLGAPFVAEIDNLKVGEGFSGQVVRTGEPLVVQDLSTDPRLTRPAVRESGFQSLAIAPLVSRGEVLGSLFVITRGRREFSQQEVELLTSIGGQIGVAVENAHLYEQAQQVAVVQERQRLARELHDSVTQSLHSSTLLAEAGQRLASAGDLERTRHYLARLGEITQQALKEMRLLVYELRPLALKEVGLVGALQQRLDAVERRAGVEARLVVVGDTLQGVGDARQGEGEVELTATVEEELYRIAEEALNNALKHAEPTSIVVTICAEGEPPDQPVELEVVDDGRGFEPDVVSEAGGLGLVSMAQRAEKIGGRLTVHSAPGEGTRVRVGVGAHE
jgi:ligand-binding sensor domain-containing protein/signal transduction histidine kinase